MADGTQLLYLEPDDEITTVVRRLREADAGRVVLVASGRAKATTSSIALRLLAAVAAEEGREVALVADAAARSLAVNAGIPAFASVDEANAEGAVPLAATPVTRAPIHVVRGEARVPQGPSAAATSADDETRAASVVRPPEADRRPAASRRVGPVWTRVPRVIVAAAIVLILVGAAGVAAVAPAATIVIEPLSVAIDPVGYSLTLPPDGTDSGEVTGEVEGTATGVFRDPTAASGSVTFLNWNTVVVEVPEGTTVAAGEVAFTTLETIDVPSGQFGLPIVPGEASVDVVAAEAGPAGNVEAEAIDTVQNDSVRSFLRGFFNNPNRLVTNPEATSGGSENREPEVTVEDVDAAVAALGEQLSEDVDQAVTDVASRLYGPLQVDEASIEVPGDLVGRRGEETFTLAGSLGYARTYLERETVLAVARERLLSDTSASPAGTEILPETISVEIGPLEPSGDGLEVEVTLTAEAIPRVEEEAVRDLVSGMTDLEAAAALERYGNVTVQLWPGWVERVPELDWRVDVRIEGDPAGESATPSASMGASP